MGAKITAEPLAADGRAKAGRNEYKVAVAKTNDEQTVLKLV